MLKISINLTNKTTIFKIGSICSQFGILQGRKIPAMVGVNEAAIPPAPQHNPPNNFAIIIIRIITTLTHCCDLSNKDIMWHIKHCCDLSNKDIM